MSTGVQACPEDIVDQVSQGRYVEQPEVCLRY
jgi:hypothetical protein